MREVEIKLRCDPAGLAALPAYLDARGYQAEEDGEETDRYYRHPDRDFQATREVLRLRTVRDLRDGTTRALLTYKGRNRAALGQSREELEFGVSDPETAEAVLDRLGFREADRVRKLRRTFRRDNRTFCLDTVEGLGAFLEIELLCPEAEEAAGRQELTALLAELDFLHPAVEPKTYLELTRAAGE